MVVAEPYVASSRSLTEQLAYPSQSRALLDPAGVTRVLEAVGLDHLGSDCDFETLSVEDKTRLCVGRCLLQRPQFVVLDPASGCGEEMVEAMHKALERAGATVITITSTPPSSSQLARHHSQLELTGGSQWTHRAIDQAQAAAETGGPASPEPDAAGSTPAEPESTFEETAAMGKAPATRELPSMTTLGRLRMMYKILLPSWSPLDGGMFLVLANILFTCVNIFLTSTVLSALPGQLEAMALQQDLSGYTSLTLWATGVRFVRCVLWQIRERCHHNCG